MMDTSTGELVAALHAWARQAAVASEQAIEQAPADAPLLDFAITLREQLRALAGRLGERIDAERERLVAAVAAAAAEQSAAVEAFGRADDAIMRRARYAAHDDPLVETLSARRDAADARCLAAERAEEQARAALAAFDAAVSQSGPDAGLLSEGVDDAR